MKRTVHLIRRFLESSRARDLNDEEQSWVRSILDEAESQAWSRMSAIDQRHSLAVTRRLQEKFPNSDRTVLAAALLHDVGKSLDTLSTPLRVLATIIGPRTQRFRLYHMHEALGAEMCSDLGVDPAVCELIAGRGDPVLAERLREADDN